MIIFKNYIVDSIEMSPETNSRDGGVGKLDIKVKFKSKIKEESMITNRNVKINCGWLPLSSN